MSSGYRKFFVGFGTLAVVLVVYLIYTGISGTPQIDRDSAFESGRAAGTTDADNSADVSEGKIGKVGDVGVGAVQKAKYVHLNKRKEVDREFGFEKLLHETGDRWELEKPFMNIFRSGLKCFITSDRGEVQVETIVGNPSPKDATLAGNVVIHILPEGDSSIKESFIYLDDIFFDSERSSFSTVGPIKLVSEDAQMLGRGFELIYNDQAERLEFLRINHLEKLNLKVSSQSSLFSSSQEQGESGATQNDQAEATASKSNEQLKQKTGEYYRCAFSENVVINTPEQMVFADQVLITNIFRAKSSEEKKDKSADGETTSDEAQKTIPPEDKEAAEEFSDIVVTCDNGIFVMPMNSTMQYGGVSDAQSKMAVGKIKDVSDTEGKATVAARKIDYCLIKDEVTLEGDCLCAMVREDIDSRRKYTLSAPKVVAELSRNDKQSYVLAPGVEHITASGGKVQLATAKLSKGKREKLLGFTKLKCHRFDVDDDEQMFSAVGPGLIAIDNSKVSKPKTEVSRLGLRKQCYVIVRDFETLDYSLATDRIVADAKGGGLLIDYIPIEKGQYGQQIAVTTDRIETNLVEMSDGRTEVSQLLATGGIMYEEGDVEFVGTELFYDAGKSEIDVWGDVSQPCLLNGSLVDGIRYDVETGRVNAEIVSPGMLQMR